MEKMSRLFLTTSLFVLSVVIMTEQSSKTIAQIRGQGTEPFFDRGNQQIEREIQRLQTEQEEDREQKDPTLEIEGRGNTDPKKPENSPIEESAPSGNGDVNKPESPSQNN